MICEICTTYGGDSQDSLIRFIAGHHPQCPAFQIDKELFLMEFERQVNLSSLRLIKDTVPDVKVLSSGEKEERLSNKITKRLYNYLCARYFPIVSNSYIYSWESDLLAVNKESHYITEYEIKISRADFKADFNKEDKHRIIADSYEYNFSSDIPNYLYYATPPGLLDRSEIPKYAGLIEIGLGVRVMKRPPLLHKDVIDSFMIDKLLKKVYYKYWNAKSNE